MSALFSIGEAARAARMTSEALRHYDRIGLAVPSQKDEWTGYRYYTEQDIVRLNTVHALQQMDFSLQKIKELLACDNLEQILAALTEAEKTADDKIAALRYSKAKIHLARADYERKLRRQPAVGGPTVRWLPRRVILLSETLQTPTLENLWNYLSHFHVPPALKEQFSFEDLAGIYTENGRSRLFAVCLRHAEADGLRVLPAGRYLCADCTEENRQSKLNELLQAAQSQYHVQPSFTVQQIVVCGILQWTYQAQVLVGR
ncbi:MAG: MerR family transcriptional regulator [Eubacteriales bacterium]|nr:MerR family transcriptional regulator [Eubacteriales bacterium]